MSKQSSNDFPEQKERNTTAHGKKKGGKFEVWYRFTKSQFYNRWCKHRSYATQELAEQNSQKLLRDFRSFGPEVKTVVKE